MPWIVIFKLTSNAERTDQCIRAEAQTLNIVGDSEKLKGAARWSKEQPSSASSKHLSKRWMDASAGLLRVRLFLPCLAGCNELKIPVKLFEICEICPPCSFPSDGKWLEVSHAYLLFGTSGSWSLCPPLRPAGSVLESYNIGSHACLCRGVLLLPYNPSSVRCLTGAVSYSPSTGRCRNCRREEYSSSSPVCNDEWGELVLI